MKTLLSVMRMKDKQWHGEEKEGSVWDKLYQGGKGIT